MESTIELTAPTPRPEWPRPTHVAIALGIVAGHVLLRATSFTVLAGLAAGLLGALTFLVVARYATLWPARLPSLELILGFMYGQFGLPITVEPLSLSIWNIVPSPESFELAGFLALGCSVAVTAGFAMATAGRPSHAHLGLLPALDRTTIVRGAIIFLPISATWIVATASIPAMRQSLAPVMIIIDGFLGRAPLAVTSVAAVILAPGLGSRVRLGLALAVLVGGMLVTSLLMEAVLPITAGAMLYWRVRGRTPLVLAGAAVAILLILQPVKGVYRELRWYQNYGVVEAWTEAFLQREDFGGEKDATEATRSRLSELSVLAYTMEMVPRVIPHTDGKAYPVIAAAVVPRFIWPDKPNLTKAGTDVFTISLGLQTEEAADRSAVGLSIPPHGFLEHGFLGSIGWTFIVGLVVGAIGRFFGRSAAGVLGQGSIFVGLTYSFASGLVYFLGTVVQSAILGTSFVWFLFWLSRFATTGHSLERRPVPRLRASRDT